MNPSVISQRIQDWAALVSHVYDFAFNSSYARLNGQPGVADFAFGNPHDMPLGGFVAALQKWSLPQNKDWFAYKMSEKPAREAAAASLSARRAVPFAADDLHLTNGAFSALAVGLAAIVDPGDEVIFLTPPWFFYELLIAAAGAVPRRVQVDMTTFDLDLGAIEAAIGPKTRAIIVNSPNNPTGRIYPPETLGALAALLDAASAKHGRPIYILSDEAYSRIVFDGRAFPSPADHYPHTLVLYTYGKTLLTPGERLGYIALPGTLDASDREALGQAIVTGQLTTGYAFPNATLQHALADLEDVSQDVGRLQARRDRLVGALREMGYSLASPEGTFYLLPRSPWPDDWAFTERLAEEKILCMPGRVVEMPGYFRISITANEAMIEAALPGFARAIGG